MVQAIKPGDIAKTKADMFPEKVIDAWNKLIAKRFTAGRARVTQEEAMQMLIPLTPNGDRREVYDEGWLDIEEVYREQGWGVKFDKPGYCETYEPYFVFTAKG